MYRFSSDDFHIRNAEFCNDKGHYKSSHLTHYETSLIRASPSICFQSGAPWVYPVLDTVRPLLHPSHLQLSPRTGCLLFARNSVLLPFFLILNALLQFPIIFQISLISVSHGFLAFCFNHFFSILKINHKKN